MAGGLEELPQENALNTRITALASLAVTCAFLDDRATAPRIYECLRPYAAQWNVLGWGIASHTAVTQLLGMLAGVMRQWDLAVQYFEAAIQDHDREGAVTSSLLVPRPKWSLHATRTSPFARRSRSHRRAAPLPGVRAPQCRARV